MLLEPFVSLQPVMGMACGLFLLLSSWEFNPRELIGDFGLSIKLWIGAFFLPFFTGLALTFACPHLFMGPPEIKLTTTALVLGIAMAVSAVPVVLKIMQELGWSGSVRARRVVLTAILCDLMAWLLFLPLLSHNGQSSWLSSHLPLLMFFVGLLCAFIWPRLTKPNVFLRAINRWCIAPVFFIGIGQSLNYFHGFNFEQVWIVFVTATASKTLGVWLAAKHAQIVSTERNAISLALNARGAMELVMANSALQAGLINHELFLSLLIMAIGTSLIIKPMFRLKLIRV